MALATLTAVMLRAYGAHHEWSWDGLQNALLQIVGAVVLGLVIVAAAQHRGGHGPLPHLGADLMFTREQVLTHEKGHKKVLAHFGIGSRISLRKRSDGLWAGETIPNSWSALDRLLPAQQAAVYLGGEVATGTKAGCQDDQAAVKAITRTGAQLREAYRIARSVI